MEKNKTSLIRKFLLAILWIAPAVLSVVAWILSTKTGYEFMFDNIVKVIVVLYCTYYFHCRANGDNYVFGPQSMSNPPLALQILSDILAMIVLVVSARLMF